MWLLGIARRYFRKGETEQRALDPSRGLLLGWEPDNAMPGAKVRQAPAAAPSPAAAPPLSENDTVVRMKDYDVLANRD